MKKNGRFLQSHNQQPIAAGFLCAAAALVALLSAPGITVAQAVPGTPLPESQITTPEGYTSHHSVDVGGRITDQSGSGAMYNTLINLHSGPRLMGENFEMRAIPGKDHGLVDKLSAFSSGFGGDPNNIAKLNMSKGKFYDFSGLFRRDRHYMDYNLLGNPNLPNRMSIPVSGSTSPYAWQQFTSSPFMFNSVRRMTDSNLTILPLSTWSFRAGYSQGIFQGPSLTPSGNSVAGQEIILQQMQRNSSDDFIVAVDWKPVRATKLTFEEQIDHYKNDSYFTLAPQFLTVQEADGTKAQLLTTYTSFMPSGYNAAGNFVPYSSTTTGANGSSGYCNASIANPSQMLYPNPSGGAPIIDPACNALTSYIRSAPTRVLFPTEIFRLQSALKNISMNGNVRYTKANMNQPNFYDAYQGLSGAIRQRIYVGYANAERQVLAADYGIVWQVSSKVSLAEQLSYSNTRQPGLAGTRSDTSISVPTTVGKQTINYMPNPPANSTGSLFTEAPPVGGTLAAYFGQKYTTNNFTVTWDATPRSIFSLTWRYQNHLIAESQGISAHNVVIPANNTTSGEVTIQENGGIFSASLRPTSNWDLNASFEAAYNDNAFTPMGYRQLRHYRVHTLYRVKPWATVSGAFNDVERHNNTNNNQNFPGNTTPYYGPLNHIDYTRNVSVGTQLHPTETYGIDLNYSYNDVYMADNICFQGVAYAMPNGAVAPGVSTQSGTMCGAVAAGHGSSTVLILAREFADAPTQFGSAALALSPNPKIRYDLGYRVSAVNGSRFFSDARDVNGSIVSTYQTPFVNVAWTVHPGLIWKGEYDFYSYGEGGASGAQYCNANANLALGVTTVPSVPCSSVPNTALTGPVYGFTSPRNFHANNVTVGIHYEF